MQISPLCLKDWRYWKREWSLRGWKTQCQDGRCSNGFLSLQEPRGLHIRLVSTYRKKGHPITKSTYMYLELTHLLSPSLFCWKSKHEAPLAPAFQPNICYRMGRRLCFPRLGNLMHCHGLQISHLGCNIRVYGACLSTWRPHISLEPRENHSYWRYTGYMDPREALTNGPSSDHGQPWGTNRWTSQVRVLNCLEIQTDINIHI